MTIVTRVIASLRGRRDKPCRAVIFGCTNKKCHPATIRRDQTGKKRVCAKCKQRLNKILEIVAQNNERVTISVQNIAEGISFLIITRCSLSTGKKRTEKSLFHKGMLERIR